MQEATDKKRKKNGESKNGRKRGIEQRYETGKNWKKCCSQNGNISQWKLAQREMLIRIMSLTCYQAITTSICCKFGCVFVHI